MALDGITVLDLSRLAPGPYCSMLLADFGADVTVIEAVPGSAAKLGGGSGGEGARRMAAASPLGRGKRSIALDLKQEAAREAFYRLVKDADVVLEGFRPGVVDRLGVDYATISKLNPRVVYCSLSGYGQTGPYRNVVGHDLNYVAQSGALSTIGRPGVPPTVPPPLVADFGGGGLFAAFAISIALLARQNTGRGQYIDMAMSDGAMSLMTATYGQALMQGQNMEPGGWMLNGGSPWYDVYECADGRYFSIGAVEGHFYAELCRQLDTPEFAEKQHDAASFRAMREAFAAAFRTKTADEWETLLTENDVCGAIALEQTKAAEHPHNVARQMVVEVQTPAGPVKQIGIAPKLSDTPGEVRKHAPHPGEHTDEVLAAAGYSPDEIASLRDAGAIA